MLSLKYAPDKGLHTEANRKIKEGEPVIEIPCRYAIGVCNFLKHLTFIDDDFEYKEELF